MVEQVFPVEISVSSLSVNLNAGTGGKASIGFKEGMIEKILEPGNFIVTLADGVKVKAQGSKALKVGNRVQVQVSSASAKGARPPSVGPQRSLDENGFQCSAFIPLGFGGKDAKARLEVFTERQAAGAWDKVIPAVYFVFYVTTQELGEVQWSVHLKGRHVALQVFAPGQDATSMSLKRLVVEVEKSLKTRGFVLMVPTLYLSRPFKAPPGFRLNVRG